MDSLAKTAIATGSVLIALEPFDLETQIRAAKLALRSLEAMRTAAKRIDRTSAPTTARLQ